MSKAPSLFTLIKEDFLMPYHRDPAIRSKIELFFNYPGVWAIINYRVANKLYLKGWKKVARFIMGISQIFTNIDIHPGCKIGRRVFIDHGSGVVIGETAIIEDDVLIYQQVTLGGVSLEQGVKRHPTIKNKAVVGAGAKVLGDIEIGENSRIGANSVVIRPVPPNSTAIGIPARVIKKGRDKNQLSHNKLPDINKELFGYLIKRINILENAMLSHNENIIIEKDKELEKIYDMFIKTIK
jgi:serine O-acetyltransferase